MSEHQSHVEELTSTPEGMWRFQQERVLLEVSIFLRRLAKAKGWLGSNGKPTGAEEAFGFDWQYIAEVLACQGNPTLRDLSDLFCALGVSLRITPGPLDLSSTEGISPSENCASTPNKCLR